MSFRLIAVLSILIRCVLHIYIIGWLGATRVRGWFILFYIPTNWLAGWLAGVMGCFVLGSTARAARL